jgi:hypothetical protein
MCFPSFIPGQPIQPCLYPQNCQSRASGALYHFLISFHLAYNLLAGERAQYASHASPEVVASQSNGSTSFEYSSSPIADSAAGTHASASSQNVAMVRPQDVTVAYDPMILLPCSRPPPYATQPPPAVEHTSQAGAYARDVSEFEVHVQLSPLASSESLYSYNQPQTYQLAPRTTTSGPAAWMDLMSCDSALASDYRPGKSQSQLLVHPYTHELSIPASSSFGLASAAPEAAPSFSSPGLATFPVSSAPTFGFRADTSFIQPPVHSHTKGPPSTSPSSLRRAPTAPSRAARAATLGIHVDTTSPPTGHFNARLALPSAVAGPSSVPRSLTSPAGLCSYDSISWPIDPQTPCRHAYVDVVCEWPGCSDPVIHAHWRDIATACHDHLLLHKDAKGACKICNDPKKDVRKHVVEVHFKRQWMA